MLHISLDAVTTFIDHPFSFHPALAAMLAEEVASCLPAAKLAAVTRNQYTGDIYGVPWAESLRVISACFFSVPNLSAKSEVPTALELSLPFISHSALQQRWFIVEATWGLTQCVSKHGFYASVRTSTDTFTGTYLGPMKMFALGCFRNPP
jgi:hypothetical protein